MRGAVIHVCCKASKGLGVEVLDGMQVWMGEKKKDDHLQFILCIDLFNRCLVRKEKVERQKCYMDLLSDDLKLTSFFVIGRDDRKATQKCSPSTLI